MGKGRKSQPTTLKILKGTQPCRVNASEPRPDPGRPTPPARFDAETVAEWDRLCEELDGLGVLTTSAGFALAIYCAAYSRKRKAEEHLGGGAPVARTAAGGVKTDPAVGVIERCEATMLRVLTEFGLTAASRSKVKARDRGPVDELGEFLKAR